LNLPAIAAVYALSWQRCVLANRAHAVLLPGLFFENIFHNVAAYYYVTETSARQIL